MSIQKSAGPDSRAQNFGFQMRRWLLALSLFFLMGCYTANQMDLDCHINGFVQSIAEHAGSPDECGAPSALDCIDHRLVCPLFALVPSPPALGQAEQTPRLLGRDHERRPPGEERGRHLGPPRAPPAVLT